MLPLTGHVDLGFPKPGVVILQEKDKNSQPTGLLGELGEGLGIS